MKYNDNYSKQTEFTKQLNQMTALMQSSNIASPHPKKNTSSIFERVKQYPLLSESFLGNCTFLKTEEVYTSSICHGLQTPIDIFDNQVQVITWKQTPVISPADFQLAQLRDHIRSKINYNLKNSSIFLSLLTSRFFLP